MPKNDIWKQYKDWLLWRVGFDGKKYDWLMDKIHDSPFEATIERDWNRAEDGKMLRDDFFENSDLEIDYDKPCSVLEMLVGLSIRIDEEFIGNPNNPHPEVIFEEMLENLGVLYCSSNEQIMNIIERWILREFDYNGEGSIFPIKNPNTDQRYLEIWDQMQEYLDENY